MESGGILISVVVSLQETLWLVLRLLWLGDIAWFYYRILIFTANFCGLLGGQNPLSEGLSVGDLVFRSPKLGQGEDLVPAAC